MSSLPANWIKYQNSEELAEATVQRILQLAEEAIASRGRFNLVTAGGTTPRRIYQMLKQQSADWPNWFVYMGDERVYPADHPERNSVDLYQAWLNFEKIPQQNIFYMQTELGLEQSASIYAKAIEGIEFDLVLLGMGEDGHTASLFPGHVYPQDQIVVTETASPKPPRERISLSFETMACSRELIKLVTGQAKKPVIKNWLNGQEFPITKVVGRQTYVYITEDVL